MHFSEALDAMKNGKRVCRSGWNGKGMFIRIRGARDGQPTIPYYPERACIEMKDAEDYLTPWLASQTDLLAEDWEVHEYGDVLPVSKHDAGRTQQLLKG